VVEAGQYEDGKDRVLRFMLFFFFLSFSYGENQIWLMLLLLFDKNSLVALLMVLLIRISSDLRSWCAVKFFLLIAVC